MTTATSIATKACPDCAENVEAVDAVCRFCGHRFGAQPALPGVATVPATSDGTPTVGRAVSSLPAAAAVALIGGILMAVGSVGPWAKTALISVSGTQGDGQITLVAAVAAIAFTVLMSTNKGGVFSAAMAALAALVGGGVGVFDLKSAHDKLQGLEGVVTIGWGIYAVIAGAGLVAIGVLLSAGKKR